MAFARKYWMQIALVVLLLSQVGTAALLRQALSNERIDNAIQRAVADAAKLKQPVNVTVNAPGGGPPVTLTVQVPSAPGAPVIVSAPPVLCRTDEECRRIYGQAEQAISVAAEVKVGTVVPVCLVDLANGVCPPDQLANRPLARGIGFTINLVRLTGGAFTAVLEPGSILNVTKVATATKPIEISVAAPPLPYNLGLGVRLIVPVDVSKTIGFAGPVYQNYGWNGVYELGIGLSTAGWAAAVGWTLPMR